MDDWYPPVYGPQVALALGPLARLSYGTALVTWLAVTTAVYLALIAWLLHATSHLRTYWKPVALGALAFRPLAADSPRPAVDRGHDLSGIRVVVPAHGRRLLAGAALGILGYKLSIFAPVLFVLAVAGYWPMLGAAALHGRRANRDRDRVEWLREHVRLSAHSRGLAGSRYRPRRQGILQMH